LRIHAIQQGAEWESPPSGGSSRQKTNDCVIAYKISSLEV